MNYDCQSCGACCYGPLDYVAVSAPERERLGRQAAARYVERRGDRLWLKMLHGRCTALRARQGHYSCRIYGARPAVCRVVEPGARECLEARRRRGLTAVR
jgi:Fe-S-cluster containining protein